MKAPLRRATPVCCLLAVVASPMSLASDWELFVDAELATAYVWRGQVGNDRPVLQPSVTVAHGGFSANLWSSVDLTDRTDSQWKVVEVDLTLSYGDTTGPLAWELGAVHFGYPYADWDTEELYASIGLESLLTPTLTLSSDVGDARGLYLTASLSHAVALERGTELELSLVAAWGSARYHDYYLGLATAAASDGLATATVSFPVGDRLTLAVALRRSWFWDRRVESAAGELYGRGDFLSGGLLLSFTP